jgi:hypothetical protein
MAKIKFDSTKVTKTSVNKKTAQGMGNIKFSSMNKKKKSNFKKYKGQGRV